MSADVKAPALAEEAPADETTAVVEEKGESPEVTEPEETDPDEEENDEASEETTEEQPEITITNWCIAAKGEDAPECEKFAKYYRSLCPGEWIDRWNEQRENGTFPGPL